MPLFLLVLLLLVVRPGATSSILAPSRDALVPSSFLLLKTSIWNERKGTPLRRFAKLCFTNPASCGTQCEKLDGSLPTPRSFSHTPICTADLLCAVVKRYLPSASSQHAAHERRRNRDHQLPNTSVWHLYPVKGESDWGINTITKGFQATVSCAATFAIGAPWCSHKERV